MKNMENREIVSPNWFKMLSDEDKRELIDLAMGAGINATHSKFAKESDVPKISELLKEYRGIDYEKDYKDGGPAQKKIIAELKNIFNLEH